MIQAVIFDMDGTLADSERLHYTSWREVLQAYGVSDFSFAEFLGYVGASNEKLAQDHIDASGLEVEQAVLLADKQRRYLELLPGIELFPAVRETLSRLQSHYRLAVASSSERVELQRILAVHGLEPYFERVVGGDMVARKKPDPDIYTEACRLMGLAPDRCLAVEDSASGVAAARRAGMTVIAVPNVLSRQHDFQAADCLVDSLELLAPSLITQCWQKSRQRRQR